MGAMFGEEFLGHGISGGTEADAGKAFQNLASCYYACATMGYPFSALYGYILLLWEGDCRISRGVESGFGWPSLSDMWDIGRIILDIALLDLCNSY